MRLRVLPVLGGGWVWIRDGRQRPPGSRTLDLAVLLALGFILFVVSFGVLAVARLLLRQERMS